MHIAIFAIFASWLNSKIDSGKLLQKKEKVEEWNAGYSKNSSGKNNGRKENRTPDLKQARLDILLSIAKHALYHLSYAPAQPFSYECPDTMMVYIESPKTDTGISFSLSLSLSLSHLLLLLIQEHKNTRYYILHIT